MRKLTHPLNDWAEFRCIVDPRAKVLAADLYEDFATGTYNHDSTPVTYHRSARFWAQGPRCG